MKLAFRLWILLTGLSATITANAADQTSNPIPLTRAHAHNDYEHKRPLLDALQEGFCSVEADIYLINGQLLVAHERSQVKPERTLQSLYLDPLRQRIQANGGRVYKDGPPVILLIDVKTEAESTYKTLREVLGAYTDILTRFSNDRIETNAITAIITGNRAPQLLAEETIRYTALDGRPEDLNGTAPRMLIPLVSQDWKSLFKWRGNGPLSEAEKQRLLQLIDQAHRQGRLIRFWGTPDQPQVWRELFDCGVDLLNADDLIGLRKFLNAQAPRAEK